MIKLIGLGAAALALSGTGVAMEEANKPVIAPARDGDIAIKEEYCAARKAGTAAAYDLFIARHPDHPLAAEARKERAKISAK